MTFGRVFWLGRERDVTRDEEGRVWTVDRREVPLSEAKLMTPVVPSKIVCVGRNYREHAKELGNPMPAEPLLFLKAPSSVLAPNGAIELPPESGQVEYEGEIALVMARPCRRLGPHEDPLAYLAGVTPLNDVTARDLQKRDVQFTRAKSFDTFCPFGPWVVPVENPEELSVRTILNGAVVQEGWARDMAFSIPFLIRAISHVMTLLPGDLIATGTPSGVGRLAAGDRICVETAGVRLENVVEG
jgi:2-keto-4-pentenoate hydratase/2-oxohepta-3-ene-1,7-dioic acid hydratase in catechol pathway